MENAVKALLIAAAVIIAVLIISLVMGVFNTGAEQVGNNSDLSEYEIQKFNDKFIQYEGTNLSASEVNAMIKTVYNHNNQQEDEGTKVTVIGPNGDNDKLIDAEDAASTESAPKVSLGAKYTVKATYNNGIVTTLTITGNDEKIEIDNLPGDFDPWIDLVQ